MTYSFCGTNDASNHMKEVYKNEWPHFIFAISAQSADLRLALPEDMIKAAEDLFGI